MSRMASTEKRLQERVKSHDRQLREFRKDAMTESDLAMGSFDDGWSAGYAAGYQQALDNAASKFDQLIREQRTSITSKHP